MSAAGPSLPPHLLAKRKRRQEEEEQEGRATASGAKSPEDGEKRRRVVGPAMPPAPLDERPPELASATAEKSDSDDDDDGFGPSLPPEGADGEADTNGSDEAQAAREPTPEIKPQRDAWMTMAPQADDLAARMDPERRRPTKFNTRKGAKGPAAATGADAIAWHETAEQKQKRLADEMMGITSSTSTSKPSTAVSTGPQRPPKDDTATARKVQQARGPSLMDRHKGLKGKEAEDDDPSKRVFDREKDMGSGMRIGQKQREEMLKKAGGFGGKFSGGSYL